MKLINGPENFVPENYYNGPVSNFRTGYNDPVPLGVWWWNGPSIKNYDDGKAYYTDVDTMFAFLIKNKVNEIYVTASVMTATSTPQPDKLTFAELGVFIGRCARYGITVDVLLGDDGSWLDTQSPFYSYMSLIEAYQTQAAPSQKFRGVHLDVEPNITRPLSNPQNAAAFANFIVNHAYPAVSALNLQMAFSIPFWYDQFLVTDGGQSMTLTELIFKYCDYVSVMSYRDTAAAVYSLLDEEIGLAKKYNRRMNVSLESIYTEEGDYVSFAEDGKLEMVKQINLLRQMLNQETGLKFGLSVHHAHTWYALQDNPLP